MLLGKFLITAVAIIMGGLAHDDPSRIASVEVSLERTQDVSE
jgi:hypothetical protein